MRRIAEALGTIVLLVWSTVALPANGDFSQLPNVMKGRWNYENKQVGAWSMVIDHINADGTFNGKVSFAGGNCQATNTPIVNGRLKSGEMTFSADFGVRCQNVAFVLRRGRNHLLEGELQTDSARAAATVWLDADK